MMGISSPTITDRLKEMYPGIEQELTPFSLGVAIAQKHHKLYEDYLLYGEKREITDVPLSAIKEDWQELDREFMNLTKRKVLMLMYRAMTRPGATPWKPK